MFATSSSTPSAGERTGRIGLGLRLTTGTSPCCYGKNCMRGGVFYDPSNPELILLHRLRFLVIRKPFEQGSQHHDTYSSRHETMLGGWIAYSIDGGAKKCFLDVGPSFVFRKKPRG